MRSVDLSNMSTRKAATPKDRAAAHKRIADMIRGFNTENGNRLFVVGMDMENRSAEEITRDAAGQVNKIFERLMAAGSGFQKQTDGKAQEKEGGEDRQIM